MGMFTSIMFDGRELQIKTGDDSCETYKLGDAVKWYIDPHYPGRGTLLDGVYDAWIDDRHTAYVVIKRHAIHAIVLCASGDLLYPEVERMFGVSDPPKEWWCEAAYKLQALLERHSKKQHDEWDQKHPYKGPALLRPLSYPIYDQASAFVTDPEADKLYREIDKWCRTVGDEALHPCETRPENVRDGKCHRRACDNPEQGYVHRDTKARYCSVCARKINEQNNEELVVFEGKE